MPKRASEAGAPRATGAVAYCDASALVKLFVEEEGTRPLRELVGGGLRLVSSALVRVEILRALARRGDRRDAARAAAYLDALALVALDGAVLDRAAGLRPATMRTLDALHLATALSLSPLPALFLCYDRRLAEAAERHGLTVAAPGLDAVHEPSTG